jgi:site-specific DNA-methyltransferase (adenine-specific)
MKHYELRTRDFCAIRDSVRSFLAGETDSALILQGDSLEVLEKFPDQSVSLILTDPPYHSTKKENITGDTAFEEDEHFLEWMNSFAKQWQRILKMNGTVYIFCSSKMSARLEVLMSRYFKPINHIAWSKPNEPGYDGWKGKMKKEALRQWYPHSERILVFEHGSYGASTANRRAPLGQFLLDARKQAGLSMKELTEATGAYGSVNHGGAVANWEAGRNIPSRKQYSKIAAALLETGKVESMPPYEDLVRAMNVDGSTQFTDVWDFKSVKPFKGKHPAEKPLDMLLHIVNASSYPGDIVLDCFAGSGSTSVAALQLGRKSIGIEIEGKWVIRAASDLIKAVGDVKLTGLLQVPANKANLTKQGTLFSE